MLKPVQLTIEHELNVRNRPRTNSSPLLHSHCEIRPAPRTVRNNNHAASTIVNDEAVDVRARPIIDEAVPAFVAVCVLVTGRVYVARHHVAAVIGHATTIGGTGDFRNVSKVMTSSFYRSPPEG